jgi:hypothetical protein
MEPGEQISSITKGTPRGRGPFLGPNTKAALGVAFGPPVHKLRERVNAAKKRERSHYEEFSYGRDRIWWAYCVWLLSR